MSTATVTESATNVTPSTSRAVEYPEVLLHYVLNSNIAESAVFGTDMHALCGVVWTADTTNYSATANPGGSKAVLCPMCADIYASLPTGATE